MGNAMRAARLAAVPGSLLLMLLFAAAGCAPAGTPGGEGKGGGRTVTDLAGRKVTIPLRVKRIACLTGASYEKALLVGAADKVVLRAATLPPWMERTNPRVKEIPTLRDSHAPNLEELLKGKLDVIFFWDDPQLLAKLASNGLAAVVPQPAGGSGESTAAFTETMKDEVRLYGQVLGGESARLADRWCDYYDRKVRFVLDRTQGLPESAKPRVYYVRGPDALTTHGTDQNVTRYGEMAGGRMVIRNSRARDIARVSMEEILAWNPEVIFVGRQYSVDLVLKDARWRGVSAVRNRRVYPVPDGVFYWDSGSEGILLLGYLAKTLHPELFCDLDMKREVRDYYAFFYRCRLTDGEVEKLFKGEGPDGRRVNPYRN